ncbi:MAG: hypothetical protein PHC43_02635 [Candidatus Marinimicrobia bacterium]|jgi:hypothetical protein|nr:hypothetical protein [Candidatus Omnitrophota bacterium]MDD5061823.1 hypothetical protein [Candidatus Neomarinimicrobiota bacterium]MDD5230199.1 hypothetical protein [Candidatus Neomarinimicrobiota bacterium]MDD5540419.1 hypothetical protein [Candidatus Neomarinimicrobiota bacterium]
MRCPNCGRDYRDPEKGKQNGMYYAGDDHFYKDQRRYGMHCFSCGFTAEIIAKPTGRPYKRHEQADPKMNMTLKFEFTEEIQAAVVKKEWTPPDTVSLNN